MRFALILALSASPAFAWEFTPNPVCTLSHETPEASVEVTFDPRLPEPYAIALALPVGWSESGVFSIDFQGARGLAISTDRQRLSDDNRTLTVSDRGFGNVLNGLEFNTTAFARFGDTAVAIPLSDAAPKVQAFRACTDAPNA